MAIHLGLARLSIPLLQHLQRLWLKIKEIDVSIDVCLYMYFSFIHFYCLTLFFAFFQLSGLSRVNS